MSAYQIKDAERSSSEHCVPDRLVPAVSLRVEGTTTEPDSPMRRALASESGRRLLSVGRWAAVAVFAAAQLFLGMDDSPVADEARHLRDGAVAWELGRIEVNPEHPPLIKLAAAAMLPPGERRTALSGPPSEPMDADARFAVRVGLVGKRLLRVRLPVIGISVLGLIAFGSLFRSLSPSAPFAATLLLGAAPPWFAHSHYLTTDVAPVAFLILAAAAVVKWRGVGGVALAGICLGAALASKFAAPLLVPFALVWIFLHARSRGFLLALCVAVITLLAVESFASRGMHASDLRALSRLAFLEGGLGGPAPPEPRLDELCAALSDASRPLGAYGIGFLSVAHRSSSSAGADYWAGSIVSGAQPLYPVETLLFKNDLPLLTLAAFGAVLLFGSKRDWSSADVAVATLGVVIYTGLACCSSLHLGVRHLLPAVALFAGLATRVSARSSARIVFWGLVTAHVVIAVAAFPHDTSYRNLASRLAVSPDRTWDLGDDWGQDLGRALKAEPGRVAYLSILQYRVPQWRALFPKLRSPDELTYPCLIDRVALDIADAARRRDFSPSLRRELVGIEPILTRVEYLRRNGIARMSSEPTLIRLDRAGPESRRHRSGSSGLTAPSETVSRP